MKYIYKSMNSWLSLGSSVVVMTDQVYLENNLVLDTNRKQGLEISNIPLLKLVAKIHWHDLAIHSKFQNSTPLRPWFSLQKYFTIYNLWYLYLWFIISYISFGHLIFSCGSVCVVCVMTFDFPLDFVTYGLGFVGVKLYLSKNDF